MLSCLIDHSVAKVCSFTKIGLMRDAARGCLSEEDVCFPKLSAAMKASSLREGQTWQCKSVDHQRHYMWHPMLHLVLIQIEQDHHCNSKYERSDSSYDH